MKEGFPEYQKKVLSLETIKDVIAVVELDMSQRALKIEKLESMLSEKVDEGTRETRELLFGKDLEFLKKCQASDEQYLKKLKADQALLEPNDEGLQLAG